MLPIQEIEIIANQSTIFFVQLEEHNATNFVCRLVNSEYDSSFETSGYSASEVFKSFMIFFKEFLNNLSISTLEVNNPCNTEFLNSDEQKEILNEVLNIPVTIRVNGVSSKSS